jgi:hypothetical protein
MAAPRRSAPARHFGNVDVFLGAIERAEPGDVLAVDNGGSQARLEEYLAARSSDAGVAFRQHLRAIGGEIEECTFSDATPDAPPAHRVREGTGGYCPRALRNLSSAGRSSVLMWSTPAL